MSLGLIMNWYVPFRAVEERAYQPIATLLAIMLIIGGIYPALYDGALPHRHLFLGGSPPPGWQNHPHDSPLLRLLQGDPGPPAAVSLESSQDGGRGARINEHLTEDLTAQKVVSVYSDPRVIVLTLLSLDAIAPVLLVHPPRLLSTLPSAGPRQLIAAEPRPPLPRPPASFESLHPS